MKQKTLTKDGRTLCIDDRVRTPMGIGHIIDFDPDISSRLEVFVKLNITVRLGSKFWFEFGEVKPEGQPLNKEQQQRFAAGRAACQDGLSVTELPYISSSPAADDWLHGWWGAYYQQQGEDEKRIAQWIDYNVHEAYSEDIAKALAAFIVRCPDYDRNSAIENRLGGISFTIPAPATLAKASTP